MCVCTSVKRCKGVYVYERVLVRCVYLLESVRFYVYEGVLVGCVYLLECVRLYVCLRECLCCVCNC